MEQLGGINYVESSSLHASNTKHLGNIFLAIIQIYQSSVFVWCRMKHVHSRFHLELLNLHPNLLATRLLEDIRNFGFHLINQLRLRLQIHRMCFEVYYTVYTCFKPCLTL